MSPIGEDHRSRLGRVLRYVLGQSVTAKTTTQKAIEGFATSRQQQADHAQSHPIRAALMALSHLAGGFVVAGFGVFGGTKLGFPWYAVALIWVAAFFVAGPNVAKATLAFIIGAAGQALTLKKQEKEG